MPEYQLHCFAQSGHSYKAALGLQLGGAEWEPIQVDFFNGAVRTDEYGNLNEMREAPVLIHGDTKLSQSGVILDYLTSTLGQWTPRSEEERREVLRWTLWDNHKLSSQLGATRFLMCFLPEEKRNSDVISFMMARMRSALKILDKRLAAHDWVAGDAMTTADLTCIGYIYYLDEVDVNVKSEYPNIARWADQIAALPNWKHPYDLMPGHPLP